MSTPNAIKKKSFAFAIRVVGTYKFLSNDQKEFVMSKQLLRSGTSVGAMYREAEQAESRADFIHKLAMAQKECNETMYWLELLHATGYLKSEAFDSLIFDARELIKLLTSIIISTKKNQ